MCVSRRVIFLNKDVTPLWPEGPRTPIGPAPARDRPYIVSASISLLRKDSSDLSIYPTIRLILFLLPMPLTIRILPTPFGFSS